MEFYEFFELIYKYVPDSYPAVKNAMQIMLPVLFAIFTGLSCFFGHFVHKIWNPLPSILVSYRALSRLANSFCSISDFSFLG